LPGIGRKRPQILTLDRHNSHNFVELISIAMENKIQITELPAHTSHWLQPCDCTLFKPLKDAYNDECQELMNAYPGTAVSHSNFCSLFAKAWNKAVTPENIKLGFQACGIYPFDSSRIPEEAYLPNKLYTNTADVTAVESNAQSEMKAHKQVTDKSTDPVSDVALATNDADVSLITSIDTSQLLEMEAMDIPTSAFHLMKFFQQSQNNLQWMLQLIPVSNRVHLIWLCMPLNLPFEQTSCIITKQHMTRICMS